MTIDNLFSGEVPDFGSDPITRAALQESVIQQQILMANTGQSIPASEFLQTPVSPLAEVPTGAVAGNVPIPGWTAQKDTGSPFRPYAPTMVTPDWTDDPNPIGAGSYDMNQVVGGVDYNPLNRGPIGDNLLSMPSDVPNPNTPREDVTGTSGSDLEY